MPKVAEHMQPKRAAKRPKAPKTGSIGQGGVGKSPELIQPPGREGGYISVGSLDTGPSAQEVHNPDNGGQGGAKLAPKAPKTGFSGQGGVEKTGADKPAAEEADTVCLPVEDSPFGIVEEKVEDAVPKGKGPPPDAIPGVCAPAAEKVAAVKAAGSEAASGAAPAWSSTVPIEPPVAMPADYESALAEIASLRRVVEQQRKVIVGLNFAVLGQGGSK